MSTKSVTVSKTFKSMDSAMIDFTASAARGECSWICASCSQSEYRGMPDECIVGDAKCTEIIKRDKLEYLNEGNAE